MSYTSQQIYSLQKSIDIGLPKLDPTFLHRDKTILDRMSNRDAGYEVNDARRTLEGVRGAHTCFEVANARWIALESDKAFGEYTRLFLRFEAKQVQH
jgi:hypothetical protein